MSVAAGVRLPSARRGEVVIYAMPALPWVHSFEVAVRRMEDTEHAVIPVLLREKYKQSGYNHTSTPLFGQPFLITVPRSISEEKLYNMLMLRMWYGAALTLLYH